MKKNNHVWVLKDLSNKDGNTYVWAFNTRREAREHAQKHRNNPMFARLSAPNVWPQDKLFRYFVSCTGIAHDHYFIRRGRITHNTIRAVSKSTPKM